MNEERKKLSSTQINLTGNLAKVVLEIASCVNDIDLAEKGRETEPHVTVFYGFTFDSSEEIERICRKTWPIRFTVGQAGIFEKEEYDVLKLDVTGEELHELNKKLSSLPNENKYPEYCPHVTIAYFKKGCAAKYLVPRFNLPIEYYADKIQFSNRERMKKEIRLGPDKL